jgi:membrane fusion protein, multidrug efflux system
MKKLIVRGLLIAVILGAGIYSVIYLMYSLSHESTDDAYVTGVVVPVSAEVKGRVVKVHISDNQSVAAGTPLLEIFQEDYINMLQEKTQAISRLRAEDQELNASVEQGKKALEQAKANLDAVLAEENLALKDKERYDNLLKQKVISQSQYDNVQSRWKVAQAHKEASEADVSASEASVKTLEARLTTQAFKIKEAEALRNLAQLDLRKTVVAAPVSGRIAMKNVDPGKYVQPGQPLLSIVKEDTWVIGNFKETQIEKMTVGQRVQVKVDAYPGMVFKGHIDSIQPGTGAVFSLLPPENATGNFIKVVQRIPVKIVMDSRFDPVHPLWPGLSVVPSVDITRQTGPKLMKK